MCRHRVRPPLLLAALILLGPCAALAQVAPPLDTSPVARKDAPSALPDGWWEPGPIMEIYVRSYRVSDGDGKGDLRGVTAKLPYLAALGVKGIWLTPVFRSQDHDHGYAVTDYRSVDPDLGTLADLDALLAAAHARGIGVVLDYAANHSARTHPAFVRS